MWKSNDINSRTPDKLGWNSMVAGQTNRLFIQKTAGTRGPKTANINHLDPPKKTFEGLEPSVVQINPY